MFEMPVSRKRGAIKLWEGLLSPGMSTDYSSTNRPRIPGVDFYGLGGELWPLDYFRGTRS
jgi:hypothetical protein